MIDWGSMGVGDPACNNDDQSIYSFRKAAPEGIRRFLDDYPEAADHGLSITQRCGSSIIECRATLSRAIPTARHGRG